MSAEQLPAAFLSPLQVQELEDISHDGRGTWKLLAPLVFRSVVAGRIFAVPVGFVTDYASVPRAPFAYWIAGDTAHPAAVVHDWLYTSHEVPRPISDAVLEEAANVCTLLPEPPPTAAPEVIERTEKYNADTRRRNWLMWSAVRLFGASHWDAPGPSQPPQVAGVLTPPQVAR